VISSRTGKMIFGIGLITTVTLKLVTAASQLPSVGRGEGETRAFLSRSGFRVNESAPRALFQVAVAGDCRMFVANVAPDGTHRHLVREGASPQDAVFFVYRGATYADQPRWLTWWDDHWRKLNGFVGRRLPERPVLGVIASPGCDLKAMAWGDLAEVRAR
jgi:hypothetical protein